MFILEDFIHLLIKKRITDPQKLQKLKNVFCEKYKLKNILNLDLFDVYRDLIGKNKIKPQKWLEDLLRKRKVRTLSGVAVVTVLTKPYPCPGKCLYCPDEIGMPKSYLSSEPAAHRAKLNHFNPYRQVHNRLRALEITGHPLDKIELIVLGGTFSAYTRKYQQDFITACLNALNHYPTVSKSIKTVEREGYKFAQFNRVSQKQLPASLSLQEAQKKNEKAVCRMVGLTLETRPDLATEQELVFFRQLGCTRVELGVQSLNQKVLDFNRRETTVAQIARATQLLKLAGFKVTYHLMPGLPGSDPKKDLIVFKQLFSDARFQPDQLKIYPCLVTHFSPLEKMWRQGNYQPYTEKQLVSLLKKMKALVPPYVRIARLIRDIPAQEILAGNQKTNLRQLLQAEGVKCRCLRCREIKSSKFKVQSLKLRKIEYEASGGKEYFLSYEDTKQDKLVAFCRLRLNVKEENENCFLPELKGCALIRELHVYGQQLKISEDSQKEPQHLGLGKKLMEEAEGIAFEQGWRKIAVIAGVGVREYYRKLRYKLEGSYMVKKLKI
ncbi:hypothetical protein AUJ78_00580 [Candidatus Peregrinibacteria bacterium CG1_02_41_10]|nr:MAG: hypothetical protein AUJ78_00580 [Candidatus Peregrinibacteria bacterium CG1_02_41_10]